MSRPFPYMFPSKTLALASALFIALQLKPALATIVPGPLFTDHAVLQQGVPDNVWGTADPGEPVTVTIDGQSATATANATGQWSVKLKPLAAGGPYTLTLAGTNGDNITLNDVLAGEVWFCAGQSNMYYPLIGFPNNPLTRAAIPLATDPELHFALVPATLADTPQTTVKSNWQEANPADVGMLSAVGYFFARDPVGLVDVAVGGTSAQAWMSHDAMANNPLLAYHLNELADYTTAYPDLLQKYNDKIATLKPDYDAAVAKWKDDAAAAKAAGTAPPPRPRSLPMMPPDAEHWLCAPTRLFNGMIAPLSPFTIKGVIWYQGEANWNEGYDYRTLFPALIADWRRQFNQGNFPFLFVQLPGHNPVVDHPGESWLAEVRQAQLETLTASPNTGMVVIHDLSDAANIHPSRKEPVGDRLALVARGLVYGEPIEYTGPVFKGIDIQGAQVRVNFDHAAGLHTIQITDAADDGPIEAPADKVSGFAIAGADKKYYFADATIDGTSVVLTSPDVPAPVAVRYGWAEFPTGNLVNSAGLLASPFRTDDWRWISKHKIPGQ